jgi:alpha-ribazole phosphatase
MNITNIYMIRHGQTVWNQDKRFQGQSDTPLDEIGVFQARSLMEHMRDIPVDLVVSSDLDRARQTALILAEPRHLEVFDESGLREINFGIWEGQVIDQVRKSDSETFSTWMTDPGSLRIPEAETFQEVQDRAMNAIDRWVNVHQGKSIVFVSHGGVIAALLCRMLKEPIVNMWNYKLTNTAVTHLICRHPGGYELKRLNDDSHLSLTGQ